MAQFPIVLFLRAFYFQAQFYYDSFNIPQVKTPFALLLEESTAPSGIKRPSEYPYYTLPMGLTASFVVKTKDDLGRQFDSLSKTSYFYTLNR